MQDQSQGLIDAPSEGSVEALLARMHSAAAAPVSPQRSPSSGMPHQAQAFSQQVPGISHQAQGLGQQTGQQAPAVASSPPAVAASDLGRVMQWAGTELLLRDQKVESLC